MSVMKVNGVQLYWELTGDRGDPVVYVHGSLVDHHGGDLVAPALARSFRVLRYDRRGYGQSERPASASGIRQDVADLAALLKELNLAPAHIVGTSFGGSIALWLAGEHPEMIRSLIVHEPPLLDLLAEAPGGEALLRTFKDRMGPAMDLLAAGQMETGVRQFVETVVFGEGAWAQLPQQLRTSLVHHAPTFLDEMRDPEAFSIDLERLGRFRGPALVTCGEQSPAYFAPIVDRVLAALPQADRKMYAGAGHAPEQSHPDVYVATLMEFWGACPAQDRIRARGRLRSVVRGHDY